jgi:tetratricopeptide (TPR) repeat protein
MADALRTARTGLRFASPWLIQLSGMADSRHCPGLRAETIAAWLQALRANPSASSAAFDDREIAPVQARVLLRQGRPEPALAAFNRALVAVPAAGVASRQATELAAAGYPREALAHLDFYDTLPPRQVSGMGMARLHSSVLAWQDYWPRELAELRGKLQAELAPAPPRPTTEP